MTNRVVAWNKQVGNKFVNELVFFTLCVIQVYTVTLAADTLVINSIEFWSGENPMNSASTKVIDTEHGRYLIASDNTGYTVTHQTTGEKIRFEFLSDTNTWALLDNDGELVPFMTFVDDNHVKMIKPDGDLVLVELSQQGVMAYTNEAGISPMTQNIP
ncbi:MAG: DUF3332 domain-containing protein [Roseburia sp.]|nr:DUF3332 domain-containing protein [Roseburia sp.]